MTNQADSEWFLRNEAGDLGPLCEAAMREHVEQSTDPDLLIRQGNSDWRSVEVIRAKIRQLKKNGIFVRYKHVTEGPFTLTRAHELLRQMGAGGIEVQTGAGSNWVPAAKWLKKIDKLLNTESREVDSLTAAVQLVLNRRGISGITNATGELDLAVADRMIETPPQPAPAHPQPLWLTPEKPEPIINAEPILEAEVISPVEPVIEVVKVMRTNSVSRRPPAVPKVHRVPMESTSRTNSSSDAASVNAEPVDSTTGPTIARTRPTNRSSRKNKTLSGKQKRGIGALSVATIVGVTVAVLLWPEESGNKSDIAATAAQRSTGAGNDSEPPLVPSPLTPAPAALADQATPEAEPEGGEPEAPILEAPPALKSAPFTVSTGMLFRPRFGTSEGEARAGTAFAAKLTGSSETLIISALHLFGPAGGLKTNIQAEKLATVWKRLVVEDCKSQNYFGEIRMQPIELGAARPHPEKSDLGDIAVCKVTDATDIEALPLSQRVPANGERVWLVSKVAGSGSLMHPATIQRLHEGWLHYSFDDDSINLQATSGAPIVDYTGSVVAVNASSTKKGGKTIGSGTPVFNFYPTLASQLQ